MTEPEPHVVWMEDGKLVDQTTAKRPYRAPAWAHAELQRVLDGIARRLLADQVDGHPAGIASGANVAPPDPRAEHAPLLIERPIRAEGPLHVDGHVRGDKGV